MRKFRHDISIIPPKDVRFSGKSLSEYELILALIEKVNELIKYTNSVAELVYALEKWINDEFINAIDESTKKTLIEWRESGYLQELVEDYLVNLTVAISEILDEDEQKFEKSWHPILDTKMEIEEVEMYGKTYNKYTFKKGVSNDIFTITRVSISERQTHDSYVELFNLGKGFKIKDAISGKYVNVEEYEELSPEIDALPIKKYKLRNVYANLTFELDEDVDQIEVILFNSSIRSKVNIDEGFLWLISRMDKLEDDMVVFEKWVKEYVTTKITELENKVNKQIDDTIEYVDQEVTNTKNYVDGKLKNAFVNVIEFGANPNKEDNTLEFQNAVDYAYNNKKKVIVTDTYKILGTVNLPPIVIEGSGTDAILVGDIKKNVPMFIAKGRLGAIRDLSIRNAHVGIQLGTVEDFSQVWTLDNIFIRGCSTGIKGVYGNSTKIFGGFIESCDVGIHLTPDTMDTNGWKVFGTRAYGCRIGFWLEGNANKRYADDNYFNVSSEAHKEYGMVLSGIRNIIDIYSESFVEGASDVLDEGKGNIIRASLPQGSSRLVGNNATILTSDVIKRMMYKAQHYTYTFDLTSTRTDEFLIENSFITYKNNTDSVKSVNLTKLDQYPIGSTRYLYFPKSNTSGVVVYLNKPEGYTLGGMGAGRWFEGKPGDFITLKKVEDKIFLIDIVSKV